MSQFTKDQLVWAKVKGFPWWPAIVNSVNLIPLSNRNYWTS